MCPENRTIKSALGVRVSNVPWEWDYPMCPGNGTIQCALGKGLSNVRWEWDYQKCPGKELANVLCEWG